MQDKLEITFQKQSRNPFFASRKNYEKGCLPVANMEQVIMNLLRMLHHRGYRNSIQKYVRKHGIHDQLLEYNEIVANQEEEQQQQQQPMEIDSLGAASFGAAKAANTIADESVSTMEINVDTVGQESDVNKIVRSEAAQGKAAQGKSNSGLFPFAEGEHQKRGEHQKEKKSVADFAAPRLNPFKYVYPRELDIDVIVPVKSNTTQSWKSNGSFMGKFVHKLQMCNGATRRYQVHPSALVEIRRPWYYAAKSSYTCMRDSVLQTYMAEDVNYDKECTNMYQFTLVYTFCTNEKSFTKENLKDLLEDMRVRAQKCKKKPLLDIIIVIVSQCPATTPILKEMNKDILDLSIDGVRPRLQFFTFDQLAMCVADHAMSPEVRCMSLAECEVVIQGRYNNMRGFVDSIGQIDVTDPIARILDLRINDVIEERCSLYATTQGPGVNYRVCVPQRR